MGADNMKDLIIHKPKRLKRKFKIKTYVYVYAIWVTIYPIWLTEKNLRN